jgi:predicted tellurium resistance membrane protein TerC
VSGKGLKAALITIIIADVSMSLDNVIAITAIARDDKTLLILGIAFAILLMAFFATAIVNLLTKFRWLSYLGLAFLIYLSGKMTFDGWLQVYPFLIA